MTFIDFLPLMQGITIAVLSSLVFMLQREVVKLKKYILQAKVDIRELEKKTNYISQEIYSLKRNN